VNPVRAVRIDLDDIALSGLHCAAEPPSRGLVIALHGAGHCAGYWDYPGRDGRSLLQLGALLGYDVLAIDRPGYELSQETRPGQTRLEAQAGTLLRALEAWRDRERVGGHAFLIGHSVGGAIALMMAGLQHPGQVAAVDVLGVPYRYPATPDGEAVRRLTSTSAFLPPIPDAERRAWLFGPHGTFDDDALAYDRSVARSIPVAEYLDALELPGQWDERMPTVRVPVQYTVAEHEVMQETGAVVLEEVGRRLINSPLVRLSLQRHTSHNASLAHVGTAYHLRAFAFFSESVIPAVLGPVG
jgi:pimeloyl-ACP methyl ester carboxylesterase